MRGGSNYGTCIITGTVGSGKSLTFNSTLLYSADLATTSMYEGQANSWDASSSKLITFTNESSTACNAAAASISGGATDVQKWLGFAESTVGTGVAVDVTILGGTNENQTGLTVGSTYYTNADGTLTATGPTLTVTNQWREVGRAITATNLLVTGAGDTTQSFDD